MTKVPSTTDNVETRHDRLISAGIDCLTALRAQWFDLSREDRREAERCVFDLYSNLRTLGVKL
jgi:hypothetical protein